MNEELKSIFENTQLLMDDALKHLDRQLKNIRAGKASPTMLSGVKVDYYGAQTDLTQVANVSTLDAQTITIQPWEKSLIQEIEKGILKANLGFNPTNNGDLVLVNVPPLTEERRKDLSKQAKSEAENAKVSIRNIRKDAMREIKNTEASEDIKSNYEIDTQSLTDSFVAKTEKAYEAKSKEIMVF